MSYESPISSHKEIQPQKTVPVKLLTKQDNFLVPWINTRKSININHAPSVSHVRYEI